MKKLKQKSSWRRNWVKRRLGDVYERFIAENYYSFDDGEWTIELSGINNRLKDLGRDLVVTNQDEAIIVQCKYWSRKKLVRESYIFQLFGTSEAYKLEHPNKKVTAVFYTSSQFSDEAKSFAKQLGVELHEQIRPNINIFSTYKLNK